MKLQQALAASAAVSCLAAVVSLATETCTSQKPEDRFTKCTADTQTCAAPCGAENICESYFDVWTLTQISADVRKIRSNEATHSRACVTGDMNTMCVWHVEDCYANYACYGLTVQGGNTCVQGRECGGPFTTDYTSSPECTPPGA